MKRNELEASLAVALDHLRAAQANCTKILDKTASDSSAVSRDWSCQELEARLLSRLEKAVGER